MIQFALTTAFALLTIAILLGFYRLARGPSVLDRVMAFDLITTSAVGMIVMLSVQWQTALYLELILIFSLLGFLTAVAFVFYLHQSAGQAREKPARPEASAAKPDSPNE